MNIIELEPYLSPIEDEISEILLKDIIKKEILHTSMSKIMNSISRILSRIGATVAKTAFLTTVTDSSHSLRITP